MDEPDRRRVYAILEVLYAAKDVEALRGYASGPGVPRDVQSYASGLLMRPWLPWGARRKVVMLLLFLVVMAASVTLNSYVALTLLAIPLSFSPRLVGETLSLVSRLRA